MLVVYVWDYIGTTKGRGGIREGLTRGLGRIAKWGMSLVDGQTLQSWDKSDTLVCEGFGWIELGCANVHTKLDEAKNRNRSARLESAGVSWLQLPGWTIGNQARSQAGLYVMHCSLLEC
jgi:hypothetical protein